MAHDENLFPLHQYYELRPHEPITAEAGEWGNAEP
ncbi:hypothetical protein CCACVL1_30773 [Corchorus capsularis]|uniref:Uncharacterized protein n=1 Tax=Corchorus capsularis TaxID=210143 RepID=A0A1R3FVK9_COCAP|nr:hypothetical protein CCACVL1_30773 [Corchorus capsularis]